MVTVNGNIVQAVAGKQGSQSKTVTKLDNATNGDFLMALLAMVGGQQADTTDVAQMLLNGDQDQQQATDEEQLMEMLTDGNLQQLFTGVQAQLNQLQPVVEIPKQVNVELQCQLENLLSNPQLKLTADQQTLVKQLQSQLQQFQLNRSQPIAETPKPVTVELQGQLEKLLSNPQLKLTGDQQALVKELQAQLQAPQSASPLLQGKPLGKQEDLLAALQNTDNEQLSTVKQQQPADTALKTANLITDLPKTALTSQNKSAIDVQSVDLNSAKQDISITSQFVKPTTERTVEQVMQPMAKTNELINQSTDTQNFSTVINSKVTGLDAKLDQVQPEQLAGRLLNMVKEMATKQQPNQTTMHLKLNPEHLGEVTIRLTYNRGELNAQFYAATAHGKEALEAVLPQMRDALLQQQVKLNEATVYLNNGGSQWLGGRQGNQGGNRGRSSAGYYNSGNYQPKVSAVSANNNKVVDDGLNILV